MSIDFSRRRAKDFISKARRQFSSIKLQVKKHYRLMSQRSSSVIPKQAAIFRSVLARGSARPCSISLKALAEMPIRAAHSWAEKPLFARRVFIRFPIISLVVSDVMIVLFDFIFRLLCIVLYISILTFLEKLRHFFVSFHFCHHLLTPCSKTRRVPSKKRRG